ncbi:inactive disease resistance protein RPS4-like [Neltuma alba]|uniref:inactive disease resistance protein RPS4-like n=1 Tax=Neltuma alba TaxID=207710 RepID=UPI0010A408CB|nr:inactive disease resistance protein RPS4-like [Prosopis alba]
MFFIILSEDYVSSGMCLEELTKIMKFRSMPYDHVVFPIFCDVGLSKVCNQESSFKEAFQGLFQKVSSTEEQVSRWQRAHCEFRRYVASIDALAHFNLKSAGIDVSAHLKSGSLHDKDIEPIVGLVDHLLFDDKMFPVGVDSRAQDVITMLHNHKTKDVVSIGIWGMAGIGKTTIAKAIFNHIQYEFEGTCFLPNVRKQWGRKLDLVSAICKATESGSLDLNERPCRKKVLVVLDDVDKLEQLNTLCESREQFGEGSTIIITTRDSRLFNDFKVDDTYRMKLLSNEESLELLSWHAFQQASPKEDFINVCEEVVAFVEGLPLALEVIVYASLYGKQPNEWKSILWKMNRDLPNGIDEELSHSIDYSLNGEEREIFLNIVLFYIGEPMHDVVRKLDGRGCKASIGIIALVDQSLVTIDDDNKLRMHNLLQLIGRQIIYETPQFELGNEAYRYDVFLSFRGEDTRTNFTSHLYAALCNAGVYVFKDDVELSEGKYIKTELLQAIGSSKIAIIIFSEKYAGSKWCLEELSMIMELHKTNKRAVLPVFYHVSPKQIRRQPSNFGGAFNDLEQKNSPSEYQVSEWREALFRAGSLKGTVLHCSRDESEYVKDVVRQVCDILHKKDLFVTEHPVGVDNRVEEVITMLKNHPSEDVVMVGIWGMGGVGKTTIAKAIYNQMGPTFESRSCLLNIREAWGQEKGKVRLQNQLLSEICKTTQMKIKNIESGKITLGDRLRHIKALVVLDDVDESDQLSALVGSHDWFAQGSRIIITTRNRHLLKKGYVVYVMKNLGDGESNELFSWHAFKEKSPQKGFIEVSEKIVAYCGGLPLALTVLGSYLLKIDDLEEWKKVLKKLKEIPNDKVQEKLKISFDNLNGLEKDIFLDICCFFIGMDKNEVTQILDGCQLFGDSGINTLAERGLLTIDENKLGMHDLLRDMGREIIREQSHALGKRSRLWLNEHARDGTEAIQGLSLMSESETMHFQTEAFEKMKTLRLLRLGNVQLRGDYKFISKDLKWLCWHHCPEKHIPSDFYQEDLVVIDLKHSNLRRVWKKPQSLESLKILNLSHSPYLVQTPDFSKLPNLEKLILKGCLRLSKIHHSIELLHKLLLLDLEDCIRLDSLPRSVYRLKCLKTLILSGCENIEKLEEDIEQMKSLRTLLAPAVKQVPVSLLRSKSIFYLSICGLKGLSRHVIPSLYRSWIRPTNNPLPLVLTHTGMPSSILSKMLNSFRGRPSTIPNSDPKQQNFLLEDGLEISNSLRLTSCMDISRLESSLGCLLIRIGKNCQVSHALSERVSEGLNLKKYSDDYLPGHKYPYWLTFKGEGDSVKYKVPSVNGHDHLKGITICCAYFPPGDLDKKTCESCIISLMIRNYTKRTTLVYTKDKLNSMEEAGRKEIISNIECDDQVEVKAIFGNEFTVEKTAVYLIYHESFDKEMKSSPSEATNLSGAKHKCEEEKHLKLGNFLPLLAATFFVIFLFWSRNFS